ncbi:MAG: DNA topoisomerase IB [Actinomycetota bacterium]|nr:DNA topoisomerase IB [Actinomycetota bacterium]
MARAPRLRRVDCSSPGIVRRRAGRGFVYLRDGERITDTEVLDRILGLAIPPAWTDVWICPLPTGHIQAVGTDAAGRKQYRYHDAWRARRDQEKFDHMLDFARALPTLRSVLVEQLASDQMDRERVLACATRLLDIGFFRIGTEGYAEHNQSYGLATIEKRHVRLADGAVTFDYQAKSGQRRLHALVDPEVYAVVEALKRRRGGGPELLAYRSGRRWADVRSPDINAYIKDVTGDEYTAKDFRTWNATVLAAVALAVANEATSPTARKRAITRAFKEVAHYLGNTPAVSRSSYVDPRLVDRYRAGVTIAHEFPRLGEGAALGQLPFQGPVEQAVVELLEDADETSRVA